MKYNYHLKRTLNPIYLGQPHISTQYQKATINNRSKQTKKKSPPYAFNGPCQLLTLISSLVRFIPRLVTSRWQGGWLDGRRKPKPRPLFHDEWQRRESEFQSQSFGRQSQKHERERERELSSSGQQNKFCGTARKSDLFPRHIPSITGSNFYYGQRAMTVDLQQKPMPPDRHSSSEEPASDDGGKTTQMPRPSAGLPSPNSTAPSSFLIKDILSGPESGQQRTRGFSPPLGSSPGLGMLHHPMAPGAFYRPIIDMRRPNGGGNYSPPLEEDDDAGHSSDEDMSRDNGNGKFYFVFDVIVSEVTKKLELVF